MAREFIKTEQIGKVTLKHIKAERADAPVYSDGEVENELHDGFKSEPTYDTIISERENYSSWAQEYHLSPVRQNLLKWFPFDAEGSVLEVGAGCGALTGLLCSKLKKVTALEYSRQRALITAMRHAQCSNLEVIAGGLQDFEPDRLFDYVTVIGVLEYAAVFYGGKNPFESFLNKIRMMLRPEGALILAIENKIGLKYICGAPEDHTGRLFDSIYGYPYPCKVQTFSKKELTDLLHSAGFCSLRWYYPLPDYKMPQEVLSEKITPTELDSVWSLFPAGARGSRRKEILAERRFGKTLSQAGLFGEFANSFLVIARTKEVPGDSECLRFVGANMKRKPDFRISKQIRREGQETSFIRSADNEESIQFLHEIVSREAVAKKYFGNEAEVVTGKLNGNSLVYPYIALPTLTDMIAEAIDDGDTDFGRLWIDKYLKFLQRLSTETCIPEEFIRKLDAAHPGVLKPLHCFRCGVIDCIPRNIMVDEKNDKWYIVDNEWTFNFPVPVDFLVFRAVHSLVVELQNKIQSRVCQTSPVVVFSGYGKNCYYLPLSWLGVLTSLEISLKQQARWSSAFQNKVLHTPTNLWLRLRATSKALKCVPISEVSVNAGLKEHIYQVARRIKQALK